MPITSDFRDWDVIWLTSRDREATYGTPLTASLTGAKGATGLFKGPDLVNRVPEVITDEDQVGRGHEFPDTQVIHSWSSELSRQWDASLFWTLWAFAFAQGAASISGAGPYTHTLKFMDENSAGMQLPSASIVEKVPGVGGNLSFRKFSGMCVNEVSIGASGKNRLQLGMQLVGDGREVNPATETFPASIADTYLRGSFVDMTINAVNLRDYIKSWSLKVNNNVMADDGYVYSGVAADAGLYRQRLFFGKRSVELAMTLLAPPSATINFESLLNAQTNAPVIITANADATQLVRFTLSNYKFIAIPKGSDNNQIIYNLSGNALFTSADAGPLKTEVILNGESAVLLGSGT